MIDIDFLESLVRLLDESSLDNLEIRRGGTRVRLSKSSGGSVATAEGSPAPQGPNHAPPGSGSPAAPPVPEAGGTAAVESEKPVDITSPMVGTFYRAPSPEADPYVEVGGNVAVGDVLCVIEAMKLMNELECETSGRIVEICADNAEPVDYGQVLFRVAPA